MSPYGELRRRGAPTSPYALDGPINKYVAPSYVLRHPPRLLYGEGTSFALRASSWLHDEKSHGDAVPSSARGNKRRYSPTDLVHSCEILKDPRSRSSTSRLIADRLPDRSFSRHSRGILAAFSRHSRGESPAKRCGNSSSWR